MSTARADDYVPDPRRWRVLGVLSVALFMALIDVSIVNVALPSIEHGLNATSSDLQWVLSGYALTFGLILVIAGRAGDLYGRAGFFVIGVIVFTAASAWAGLAPTPLWLNIARAVEGIGSGLISPQVIGMIQQYFRGAERGRAFGVFGGVVGVSVAVGPVLGGLLIQLGGPVHGWRWVFFVNVPVGVVVLLLAALWMPRPMFLRPKPRVAGTTDHSRDLDPVGAVLLGLAVTAILLPFVEAESSPAVWWALPAGILLVVVWLWWEGAYARRGRNPMVNLGIFHIRSFANGTLLVGLYFLGITSIWVLVALYFQSGLGHSALESGLVGLPSAIISGISALWAGRLVARYGRTVVIIGLWFVIIGLVSSMLVVWLITIGVAGDWWLLLSLALLGVGQGSVISPNQALTLAEVPLEYAGSSGGVMQTIQRIGTSTGIAIITAIAFAALPAGGWSGAFLVGFAVIAVIVGGALVVGYVDAHQRGGVVRL